MIRPEFRKILLDQRGAAIILWSFFAISIPIYLVIARQLLGNPSLGTNPAIAEPSRIIFWILTVVDIGYYVYWRKKYLTPQAIRRDARQTKLFRAVAEFQRRRRAECRLQGIDFHHPQSRHLRDYRSDCGLWLCASVSRPLRRRPDHLVALEFASARGGVPQTKIAR